MAKQKKEKSFEENLQRIEEIIEGLNSMDIPLQQAIERHTEACKLIKENEGYLHQATLQLETLL